MVIDAQEYAELMRLKRTLDTDNVYRLTSESPKEVRKAPRATLDILGRPAMWLIDTGSPVNILHEGIFDTLNPRPRLDRCNTTYYAFRSEDQKIIGVLELRAVSVCVNIKYDRLFKLYFYFENKALF